MGIVQENRVCFETRAQWRSWLGENFENRNEIWLLFPLKKSGKIGISYNDAVEEALCFKWIDSTVKSFDENYKIQKFTPRNNKSTYSQANKERLHWLLDNQLIHPKFVEEITKELSEAYVFPEDIIQVLKAEPIVWKYYQTFSDSYKRIRIAYINAARKRPDEFDKRLNHFVAKTRQGILISGYGGIDKYY